MSEKVLVKVRIDNGGGLPTYATAGASGADVRAALEADIVLLPGQYQAIPTKLYLEIPVGYEVQIRPRSGLALKEGITVLNTPGTIDHDYRGELKVLLVNFSDKPFVISHGMRVAQAIVAPVLQARFEETELVSSTTERGAGGFGSSGLL